jgi:hypothetical protein
MIFFVFLFHVKQNFVIAMTDTHHYLFHVKQNG